MPFHKCSTGLQQEHLTHHCQNLKVLTPTYTLMFKLMTAQPLLILYLLTLTVLLLR